MYELAKRHFKKADPVLHRAAQEWEIPDVVISEDLFRDIVWTIVGQQLSSRAADTIFGRFKTLFSRGKITAKRILALHEDEMRACGLSGAKGRAIKAFAQAVETGELDMRTLATLDDANVLAALTKVKGIGPWTAEMILMFSLGRPDIFSKGDLGLRKGVMQLYGLKNFPDEKKLLKIVAAWSPYRTYAARILWKVADAQKNRIGRKRPEVK
jgi:DNA-3-methyladenine glycosylase II